MAASMMIARSAGIHSAGHGGTQDVAVAGWMPRIEEHPAWEMLSQIGMTLRAEVALEGFRVRDLLTLAAGQVFETSSPDTDDVPIRIGNVQLGWGEFEVVEQQMALRVTRLD